jgi:hypothetical protein
LRHRTVRREARTGGVHLGAELSLAALTGIGRAQQTAAPGTITTVAARLSFPQLLALDQAGNLFIKERGASPVAKLRPEGLRTIVAGTGQIGFSGDGGSAREARLDGPGGIAIDADGNLLIVDAEGHRVLKLFGVAAPGLIGGEPFPSP